MQLDSTVSVGLDVHKESIMVTTAIDTRDGDHARPQRHSEHRRIVEWQSSKSRSAIRWTPDIQAETVQ
jgi:hypothetical protein